MSLETQLERNTTALEKMTELLIKCLAGEIPTKPVVVEHLTAPETEKPEATTVTYEETAALIMSVAKELGKHTAVSILETFEVTTLKQANPSQYSGIAAACEQALQG